ncbi:hypothetical protein G210_5558 [Candida maltosa Xu316]|uniref:Uncharacterized protein n=1 Tax=Candida maltosa (strain Xu316) TaxID=1245528 RepID=M3JFX6_CANMX|nr:hypothetical protein G210_5558 [Candida maltosa Xu316]
MVNELSFESITKLYSSHDASEIQTLQERLQTYQKSEIGYNLGLELLKHEDKNVKYFGALTITVYFNTHDTSLIYVESFNEISNVIRILVHNDLYDNMFIVKKLLSNLSLLVVLNFSNLQFDPVEVLKSTLLQNGAATTTASHFQNEVLLEIVLLFLSIIVEDIIKIPKISPELHDLVHATLFKHCYTIFEYLYQSSQEISMKIKLLSLDCLSSWVQYIAVAENSSSQRYTSELEVFIMYLLNQLDGDTDNSKMEVLNKTFTVFTEIVDNIPRMLTPFKSSIFMLLFGDRFGVKFINAILTNQDFREMYSLEIENFVNLVISYLTINMVQITRNILDNDVFNVIQILTTLTDIPGIPTEDENISEQFILFWEELASTFVDDSEVTKSILSDENLMGQYNSQRDQIFSQVSQIYFRKLSHNPGFTREFKVYRSSVADLFVLLYSLLGVQLYSHICSSVSYNVSENHGTTQKAVNNLEVGLYLIYKITADIYFHDSPDEQDSTQVLLINLLHEVFSKNLIVHIQNIPDYADKQISITLINLISVLPFFFKSEIGGQYLPETFNFLFNIILNKGPGDLSVIASKAVSKICQDSETKLIPFLPNLEMILFEMLKIPEVDNFVREKVTDSYISVARSAKNPIDLGNRIYAVLLVIQNCFENLSPELEDYAISLITCVAAIGQASAYPEEIDDYLSGEQIQTAKSYWTEDPLGTRSLVLKNLKQFSLTSNNLARSTRVTEKCCKILKSGLREEIPGPFTFDISVIFEYLTVKVKNCNIESICTIHQLIESIVMTKTGNITTETMEPLLQSVFVEMIDTINSDVDLIKSSLDMFTTILEKKPNLLLHCSFFKEKLIPFGIYPLTLHETFVVKSSIKFWNTLVAMKRGNSDDHRLIKEIITGPFDGRAFGNILMERLLTGFSSSPRSGIDHYYPLFRNLIAKYPMESKNWLQFALANGNIGKAPLNQKDTEMFINKLSLTRGQRQANEILKDFWLKVNKLIN